MRKTSGRRMRCPAIEPDVPVAWHATNAPRGWASPEGGDGGGILRSGAVKGQGTTVPQRGRRQERDSPGWPGRLRRWQWWPRRCCRPREWGAEDEVRVCQVREAIEVR